MDNIKEYAFYLKNNSREIIIKNFKEQYLEKTSDSHLFINNDNMIFIWKKFLKEKKLPLILFSNELQENLNLPYNKNNDIYYEITSRKLNKVKLFNSFWNKYIVIDKKEQDFKIGEIVRIYNHKKFNNKLTEDYAISIIEHFHNKLITDNKYIHGISCILWNKEKEIDKAINAYNKNKDITILNLYKHYCNYSKNIGFPYIVTKKYFEKYIIETIPEQYIFNDYICSEYWDIV